MTRCYPQRQISGGHAFTEKLWLLLAHASTVLTSGKNIKPLLRQKQFGSISTSTAPNDELALDFAGPFSVGTHGKRYLFVSIDNFSGWPDVKLLREPKTAKRATPFERHFNRRPNTITEMLTHQNNSLLTPNDPTIQLNPSDFSSSDSNILVRERTRGSKLESAYQKRRGQIVNETNHTVTFQPANISKTTTISKRGIGMASAARPVESPTPLADELFGDIDMQQSAEDIALADFRAKTKNSANTGIAEFNQFAEENEVSTTPVSTHASTQTTEPNPTPINTFLNCRLFHLQPMTSQKEINQVH